MHEAPQKLDVFRFILPGLGDEMAELCEHAGAQAHTAVRDCCDMLDLLLTVASMID